MGGTKRTRRDGGERRRGRVIAVAGVYLLWGVLLTWGVAWGVAAVVSPWRGGELFRALDMDRPRPQLLYVDLVFGATSVVCVREASAEEVEHLLAPRGEMDFRELPGFAAGLVPGERSLGGERAFAIHATGWPWRASSYTLRPDVQGNLDLALPSFGVRWTAGYRSDPEPTGALRVGGKVLESWRRLPGDEFWFPCIPLWKGLIADTLFYALLVWCLRCGFVRLRGWHRRHRLGSMWRCPCGYDLRGLVGDVCPECGRPVGEASPAEAAGPGAKRYMPRFRLVVAVMQQEGGKHISGLYLGALLAWLVVVLQIMGGVASIVGSIVGSLDLGLRTTGVLLLPATGLLISAWLVMFSWFPRMWMWNHTRCVARKGGAMSIQLKECWRCHYDQTGTPGKICPECGSVTEIDLKNPGQASTPMRP